MDKIFIASDHAGFELKEQLVADMQMLNFINLGTLNSESVDYPDYASKLVKEVKQHGLAGVLICGTGIGMSIAANRHPEIRAALCMNEEMAKLAREHNDANILILGARLIDFDSAKKILETFVKTNFDHENARHSRRLNKIGDDK